MGIDVQKNSFSAIKVVCSKVANLSPAASRATLLPVSIAKAFLEDYIYERYHCFNC